ncbi:hypothetical protein DA098_03170 [Vibrio parahaemolyticus]|nr:hypothetical protein DA098_03170 [Vibrio parahaemolyticus]TMX79850.1 hypothetical protein DA094_05030 [Vibrio parahaemolyticus]
MSQGYDLADFLQQFGMTISDLQDESGRPRGTLYQWYKRDRQLLDCIIRSRLLSQNRAAKSEMDKRLELLA